MRKAILTFGLKRSKKYLSDKYSAEWFYKFRKISTENFDKIDSKVPGIGKSIFSLNYNFGPAYISWYLALEELGVDKDERDKIIWKINENIYSWIPQWGFHIIGKSYFESYRKNAQSHIARQNSKDGVHPFDWQIEFRNISKQCYEIDIKRCGLKILSEYFGAEGLLPGICRIDYMLAAMMGSGFERTKTLGDGDECCNCRYLKVGETQWKPEKGYYGRERK